MLKKLFIIEALASLAINNKIFIDNNRFLHLEVYMKNIHSILLLILTLLVNSGFACSNISIKTDLQNESEWLKPGLLNSKRIELKFGSYGVQAIPQENNQVRLSNLFSISQGRKYTRTIALTLFTDVLDPSLEISHQEILNGGSIGIVLNKNGFLIKKDIFYIDELNDASLFSKFMDVDMMKKGKASTLAPSEKSSARKKLSKFKHRKSTAKPKKCSSNKKKSQDLFTTTDKTAAIIFQQNK